MSDEKSYLQKWSEIIQEMPLNLNREDPHEDARIKQLEDALREVIQTLNRITAYDSLHQEWLVADVEERNDVYETIHKITALLNEQ